MKDELKTPYWVSSKNITDEEWEEHKKNRKEFTVDGQGIGVCLNPGWEHVDGDTLHEDIMKSISAACAQKWGEGRLIVKKMMQEYSWEKGNG